MSSIENRVVSITFDNAGFESAIANTLAGLEDLKGSLDFSSAKDPFAQLKDAASGFSLDNIGAAVDDINSKFSALGAVGFTAIQSLTQSAINAGGRIASALVDPIVQGRINATCPCVDINVACTGFIYALDMADAYFATGRYKKILIICAEEPSKFVDWSARDASILFGDGSGAVGVTNENKENLIAMNVTVTNRILFILKQKLFN